MTKKEYLKPVMEVIEADIEQQILAGSVQTTGLGDELSQDENDPNGDAWNDAMSRRKNDWDDEELLEEE